MSLANRREFLRRAGLAAGAAAAQPLSAAPAVSVTVDPHDTLTQSPPVRWAVQELKDVLHQRGVAEGAGLNILVAGPNAPAARGAAIPKHAESLVLAPQKSTLLASGRDTRGIVYAVLELADRVRYSADPAAALALRAPVAEQPANTIRSVTRCFVSDVEDKPWYNDRSMWGPYLSLLAAQRFNRFSLAFGIGYDFARQIRDCYFHFAYPFLLDVPGYKVRATNVPDAERDRNLEMLRYISDETVARGLDFQLGLWTHAYEWMDSPNAKYIIEGLTPANHAAYCRDALAAVLKACPAISGITFRVHGESGVAEGSYDFWRTLFDAIVHSGRRIEIDMHAKGMDDRMIETALSTGMPVNISPKYWAEHMGLPYHQAAIRELEMPPRDRNDSGFFALSNGSRRFMRYGYGDLLRRGRRYGVLHRIWPGTQRVLLSGDPLAAAAYGRASGFCGSAGVEICEPLSFKGRKGSGLAGGRQAYADASLATRYDWQKYEYTYRVWGRLLYNPDSDPGPWRRYLASRFQNGADSAEAALAHASRILPLITTAHGASAANNNYWPEMYTNMPIVDGARRHPYGDTPTPKRFGWVSPFDPQLFSRVDDFAQELLKGPAGGKYSPAEVAQWLEAMSATAARHAARIDAAKPEARRLVTDVRIDAGIGQFFAAKLRAGVLYALYEHSGDRGALEQALAAYRSARKSWVELADLAKVYRTDVTFGFDRHLRGHWRDRLPAIDEDIADMEKRLADAKPNQAAAAALDRLAKSTQRPDTPCRHLPAGEFTPGQPLAVELVCEGAASARMHYRHVNQSESWRSAAMEMKDQRYHAAIPADYTKSPFGLQYYFELRNAGGAAWLHPGFNQTLTNQPYFVVPA